MTPGTVVSYPGTMMPAQQVALAFHEAGDLKVFATTFAVHPADRLPRWLPARAVRELKRREIATVPADRLHRQPAWEVIRTAASRAGASAEFVDRVWDRSSRHFDRSVGALLDGARRVYAYEYTALATFEKARARGIQTVLDLPSLDSRELESQLREEAARHPYLANASHPYFESKFDERERRRRAEIAAADLLIVNSKLTAASHIAAGADPGRIRVVPLAGPPPAERIRYPDTTGPLRVILASGLSPRKGAHHFFDAWELLKPGPHARALVFGQVHPPEWVRRRALENVEFRGAVPQPVLFDAIATCDVLVFPTISDGFGMVVTEALAQGVPVITTDRAGAADRIEHGRNGLVVAAAQASALREALQWCLDNRQALARMREEAHRSAGRWQWQDYRAALRKAVATP